MKQTDFDRLKAVCEKEGFEILNLTHDDNEKYVLVKKQKDIWEGVEFYRSKWSKSIYNINRIDLKLREGIKLMDWEPSTESAYIEQLKAECFKRFGEIKEGDRFDRSLIGYGKDSINFMPNRGYEKGFDYSKESDTLYFDNLLIYESGKWATRVKERVKVVGAEINKQKMTFYYTGKIDEMIGNISIKLEEYLNKE